MVKKLLMLVVVLSVTGIASAELLEDGGFETGWWPGGLNEPANEGTAWDMKFIVTDDGNFTGGATAEANPSWGYDNPSKARSGERYLRVGAIIPSWSYSSWGYAELGQIVTAAEGAAPGVEYTLTAYFMDDWGSWGDTGTRYAYVKMNFKSSTGGNLPGGQTQQEAQISSDWNDGWQPVSLTVTAPAGTAEIRCLVGTGFQDWVGGTGEVGFVRVDDVTLCSTDPVAFAPDPAVGATVGYTCQTDLSWETCAAGTFDVYLKEGIIDPNVPPPSIGPGDLIAADVTTNSVSVTLANNTDYFWRVDGTTTGELWSFSTGDVPPSVDAGSDQYLVLDPDATASLDGTLVCDDGNSSVTYLWTASDPNAVTIASPTSLVTTATIPATSSYTFTLTATDASGSAGNTMVANVYDDACEAAKADPTDYTTRFDGDLSDDCLVNLIDLSIMATEWLGCASTKLGCTP